MNWIFAASVPPVLNSITNIVDKYLLDKRQISTLILTLVGGLLALPIGVVLLVADSGRGWPDMYGALWCFFAGILSVVYVYPYAEALSREDASTVVPLFGFAPLLGISAAVVFLGEPLYTVQFFGAAFIIVGGVSLGVSRDAVGIFRLRTSLYLMFLASAVYALIGIFMRLARLNDDTFVSGISIEYLGMAAAAAAGAVLFRSGRSRLRLDRSLAAPGVVWCYLACAILGLAAIFFESYAISLAGVVKTRMIGALQPVVLFVLSAALSRWCPYILHESLDRATVLQRGAGIASIVLGGILLAG